MTGNIVALMYLRLNRQLSAGDYIAWANAELARGCELPEIAEMASFALERDPDAREVERYFLQCVQLLGIHMPEDAYQATRDYWAQTCDRMLDGSLGLDEGIALLYDIDDDQGYDLMQPWIDLSHHDGAVHWHDKQQQIVATDIARHGHDAYTWMLVRQFAALCRLPEAALPQRFPCVWHCVACGADGGESTGTPQRTARCPACGGAGSLKNMRYLDNRQALL